MGSDIGEEELQKGHQAENGITRREGWLSRKKKIVHKEDPREVKEC